MLIKICKKKLIISWFILSWVFNVYEYNTNLEQDYYMSLLSNDLHSHFEGFPYHADREMAKVVNLITHAKMNC